MKDTTSTWHDSVLEDDEYPRVYVSTSTKTSYNHPVYLTEEELKELAKMRKE